MTANYHDTQQDSAFAARYDSLGSKFNGKTLDDYVNGQSFCCNEKKLDEIEQNGEITAENAKLEDNLYFYHPDHLGSTNLITNFDGEVTQSVAYVPYGEVFVEERNGSWATPFLFNAKELDEETGLYYYGARYLNPVDCRWLSVDPMWDEHKGISPYNYCLFNPIKKIDPDGRWEENADGNLVAQKGDNAWTFAKYLNTTPEIAIEMLGEQGYNVEEGVLKINAGDIFKVEHSSPKPELRKDLGFMGNQIRKRAHSEYSQNLFENYWNGGGDVEMSSDRFAGILLYMKKNNPKMNKGEKVNIANNKGDSMEGYGNSVSFYSSYEYDYAFGTATLYTNSKDNIVGFFDLYDFDPKPLGKRSLKAEAVTRAVKFTSPNSAKTFNTRYGFSKR